ncbi:hypothetical protein [Pannonibacter sp. I15F10I1]|uniref:beta strand repeat-containing protein n=1 Tax=Pannonibacter sp. I15F10I1 TaxID=2003580 RepID=UPI001644E329|nr:hypothetical protein [Pannonibacter sp. I15F10I1]
MALAFDATYYLSARPDVFNAFVATAGSTGLTWAQFAERHYDNHGRFEGANPNTTFNTKDYLTANPDVAAAGVNPFTHFMNFGAKEGRAPSATFPSFASFDDKAYLAANADLAAAGITTKNAAYEHFVKHGQFESRPGAPVVDSGVPGQTFTLTTGVDTLTGTANNDTFVAVAATTGATFNTADTINGGAGKDTLNLTVDTLLANSIPAASTNSVEIINVRNVSGAAQTVAGSNFVGHEQIWSDRSADSLTITAVNAGAAVGVRGNALVTNNAVTATYVDAATAATLAIAGGTLAGNNTDITINGAGLTAATITSTGAANKVDAIALANSIKSVTVNASTDLTVGAGNSDGITGVAAGSTLTVIGTAANVDLDVLAANFKSVDASAFEGGVKITLDGDADTVFKGGKGADVVTTGAVLTTGSVDGGAGRDTLNIGANVTHANTAALAAKYTNFEVLRVNGTFDASLIAGIEAIELSGATNNISKLSATQAANITALADIGATTLALSDATGTADAVSVTFGDGKGAAFDAGALTINGFETLNVKANAKAGDADQTTTIASLAADKLTAINLTGSAVTLTNAATTKAVTIDGSKLTGNGATTPVGLTISGNLVAGSTVTGSATAGNTFNLGTAGSSYTGGAGKDNFAFTAVTQLRDGATYNKLDGGAGSDTATLTAGGAAVTFIDDDFKEIKNIEKLVIGNTGDGNAISVTTGGWYDGNFKSAGSEIEVTAGGKSAVTFAGGTFSGAQKLTVTTSADAQDVSVLTGSGNDTVKVVATALTTGDISVNTGAGTDSIEIEVSAAVAAGSVISVNGGAGKDTIKFTGLDAADAQYVTVTVGAGDSTITAYDSITGFSVGGADASVKLDFAGAAAVAANQAAAGVTGYTAAELTYTINSGVLTFAGSKASGLDLATKITLVDTLVTANLSTAAFEHSGNTYVYNENTGGDSLVELVGITGVTALSAAAGGAANTINIA